MPKPRTPAHLMDKNKKHYSKADIKNAKDKELPIKTDKIKPSEFLPKKYHKRFNYFVKELSEWGLLSNLDSDALSRYILIDHKYWEITTRMEEIDVSDSDFSKLAVTQNKYFEQSLKLSVQLGLTMAGRMKLEKKPDFKNEKQSDEEVLFGNGFKLVGVK